MDDYYEYNEAQSLRLSIWETNEGPEQGYVKWSVEAKDTILGWYWITPPSRPTSYDLALAYARVELMYHENKRAIKDAYDGPTPPSVEDSAAARREDEAERSEAESGECMGMSTWSQTTQRLLRSMEVHANDGISETDLTDDEMASLNALRSYGLVYKNAISQTFRMTDKGRIELHRMRIDYDDPSTSPRSPRP